jgi:glycosyltransferase involved in cell wall biosynthesis
MIVPCYNEANRFPFDYWKHIIEENEAKWIFVDDGSKDSTLKILQELISSKVRVLSIPENKGKSEAIRYGFHAAFEDFGPNINWIGYIDSDGAFDIWDIQNMFMLADSNSRQEMLWTSRVNLAGSNIQRSSFRHYVGRILSTLIWRGLSPKIYDTQSGFKIIPYEESLQELMSTPFQTKWFVDLEIYSRWIKSKLSINLLREIPLQSWKEIKGSKITVKSTFRVLREIKFIRSELKGATNYGSKGA